MVNWISRLVCSCGVNSCQRGIVWPRTGGGVGGGGLSAWSPRVTLVVFLRAGETLLTPACQLQENLKPILSHEVRA